MIYEEPMPQWDEQVETARAAMEQAFKTADEMADRIEALLDVRDTLRRLLAKQTARAERLEAAMREAIMLAEQPHYGDRGDALDHCFDAIDVLRATLKGADHD